MLFWIDHHWTQVCYYLGSSHPVPAGMMAYLVVRSAPGMSPMLFPKMKPYLGGGGYGMLCYNHGHFHPHEWDMGPLPTMAIQVIKVPQRMWRDWAMASSSSRVLWAYWYGAFLSKKRVILGPLLPVLIHSMWFLRIHDLEPSIQDGPLFFPKKKTFDASWGIPMMTPKHPFDAEKWTVLSFFFSVDTRRVLRAHYMEAQGGTSWLRNLHMGVSINGGTPKMNGL